MLAAVGAGEAGDVAIGINGPPQNQTCCKLYEWGQNMDVTTLHSYLQDLAVALINPVQANPG
jgi:hypothetical protein